MNRSSKIYVAGHTGLVGSAITRNLKSGGYDNLIFRTFNELDLTDQQAVEEFFSTEKPEYVFLAAALVGGIVANNTYRADFIYNNLMIQNNVIHACWKHGVKKLLFLGSTCIYPKNAPQPLKEEYLLTAPLEYTNEPYAIAKIAGLKTCESFNIQYGTDFIAVMPTNLYGPGDNYNLEKSHVLPALMRKIHLGKCFEEGNTDAVRKDLKKHPVEGLGEDSGDDEIISVLGKYGVEVRSGFGNGTGTDAGKRVVVSVWGTGAPYREFMHSDDMARACIYIMEKVSATDI
ncbi:MAG: GDP-L-fucose synthase, partial [Bacteroidales bacterium]|nr:GDP-L-fucose synthase [Bacteroidales bacterium]